MKMSFEQGPYRPPNEARSLLLRFTRNCPWNKCAFCSLYKRRKFSRRSVQEILEDIDAVSNILQDIYKLSNSMGYGGNIGQQLLNRILTSPEYSEQYKQVAFWAFQGEGNVFIQDANSLIMKAQDLVTSLSYLRKKLPNISRVTSYARSSTIARKSLQEMREIKEAGLDRIHVGMESGSDQVLKFIQKGCTSEQHILAGQKAIESGMTLSEYIMPGLGGVELSKEHALETARVLNNINPHFIRLRTLQIVPRAPLFEALREGRFQPLSEDEIVREIRLLIESLQNVQSTLTSDHIMNLLEEVQGTFSQDKDYMLQVIDSYLNLSLEDKLLFRLGRRGGALRSTREIRNPMIRSQLENAKRELEKQEGKDLETIITEMGTRYI